MRFPYSEREVDPLPGETGLQVIHEPIVLVRFIGPKRSYLVRGLLDTGASMTLVPRSYMIKLGIDPGERARLGTAAGHLNVSLGTLDIEIRSGRTAHRWTARVGFSPRADNLALLGHAGFLDHFTAIFNGLSRQVTLRPNVKLRLNRFLGSTALCLCVRFWVQASVSWKARVSPHFWLPNRRTCPN